MPTLVGHSPFVANKPPAGCQIDWGHPLARDLTIFLPFLNQSSVPIDLVYGAVWTNTGVLTQPGKFGMCPLFVRASSTHLSRPADYATKVNAGSWTINGWLNRFTDTGGSSQQTATKQSEFDSYIFSNGLYLDVGAAEAGGVSVAKLNTWYMWSLRYDAAGGKIGVSVNGSLWSEATVTTPSTSANAFNIGASNVGGNAFDGLMDVISVYRRALSVAELRELYAEPFCVLRAPSPTRTIWWDTALPATGRPPGAPMFDGETRSRPFSVAFNQRIVPISASAAPPQAAPMLDLATARRSLTEPFDPPLSAALTPTAPPVATSLTDTPSVRRAIEQGLVIVPMLATPASPLTGGLRDDGLRPVASADGQVRTLRLGIPPSTAPSLTAAMRDLPTATRPASEPLWPPSPVLLLPVLYRPSAPQFDMPILRGAVSAPWLAPFPAVLLATAPPLAASMVDVAALRRATSEPFALPPLAILAPSLPPRAALMADVATARGIRSEALSWPVAALVRPPVPPPAALMRELLTLRRPYSEALYIPVPVLLIAGVVAGIAVSGPLRISLDQGPHNRVGIDPGPHNRVGIDRS
jgi:hypothetical protein